MSNLHEGHRQRLKDSCIANGLDTFNDINALELLLFYAIPRTDTNTLAHELLNRFGSLDGVFKASVEELKEIKGIGDNAALLISLVSGLNKKRFISKTANNYTIDGFESASAFFIPRFMDEREEVLFMACLDSKGKVTACKEVSRGVVNSVEVSQRRIAEIAMKNKAVSVILAHNHPEGYPKASREDEVFTRTVLNTLKVLDIRLLDHLIVADGEAVSCCREGLNRIFI